MIWINGIAETANSATAHEKQPANSDHFLYLSNGLCRFDPETIRAHGLNAAIADQLADCQPDDPAERRRYLEINGALTRCAELYSAALAR